MQELKTELFPKITMNIHLKEKQNLITYFAFLLIAVVGIFYGKSLSNSFQSIRVWDFNNLAIMTIGIPFLFLQSKANLPNFWEATLTNKQRLFYPFLIGAFFGILDILVIKVLQHPEPYAQLPPFLQPFPYSIFLYFSGAFEVEVFYRLIPLTMILFIGKTVQGGVYYKYFLWIGLILTSLREPIEQLSEGSILYIYYSLITGFLMNFFQAKVYTQYGFLSSLAVRLGHYLFWHILLGIYVQFFELQ
jgi:hypothetical protein